MITQAGRKFASSIKIKKVIEHKPNDLCLYGKKFNYLFSALLLAA